MNIFIASLSFSSTDEDLQALFEQFGSVDSAKVVMDRETGRSRGFGFVEMPNDDEARTAISDLNDSEFAGRTIIVKEAKPKEGGSRGGGNHRRSHGDRPRGGGYERRGGYQSRDNGGSGYQRSSSNEGGYQRRSFDDRNRSEGYESRGGNQDRQSNDGGGYRSNDDNRSRDNNRGRRDDKKGGYGRKNDRTKRDSYNDDFKSPKKQRGTGYGSKKRRNDFYDDEY